MFKSIMQTNENECYLANLLDVDKCYGHLDTHHICNGPKRDWSEENGGVVKLCRHHHQMVHNNPKLAKILKQEFQATYEFNHTHEEWMKGVGKNYL